MRNWIVLTASLTAPAAAFAQNVNVDSDASANFATDRPYGWTAGTPSSHRFGEGRIRASIAQPLIAGSFTSLSERHRANVTHTLENLSEQYPPRQK